MNALEELVVQDPTERELHYFNRLRAARKRIAELEEELGGISDLMLWMAASARNAQAQHREILRRAERFQRVLGIDWEADL